MNIIRANVEILDELDGKKILEKIERAYRVCYKSEGNICEGSAERMIKNMALVRGHESPLEHFSFSVKFICDRGVSHEIVRHRLAAYSQESTRYCNYSKEGFGKEITVIEPCFWKPNTVLYEGWRLACWDAEEWYFNLLHDGATPQEARSVLPNSLKTELIMTANLREWRHFLKLRCDKAAHPQFRELALSLLKQVHDKIPVVFDDIWEVYKDEI